MAVTLEQIRAKYEGALYPPDPDCRKCKGAGEWLFARTDAPYMTPCACLFFGDDTKEVTEILAEAAPRLRKKMVGE